MSETSEFTPEMLDRQKNVENAKNDQDSAAPPAGLNDAARTPYRKRTRRFRFHEQVEELSKRALWKDYITAKFDALYAQHLAPFRLPEDTKSKRSKLKKEPGYPEAHNAFRRAKKAFIKRLVQMMKEPNGELLIDKAAREFVLINGN